MSNRVPGRARPARTLRLEILIAIAMTLTALAAFAATARAQQQLPPVTVEATKPKKAPAKAVAKPGESSVPAPLPRVDGVVVSGPLPVKDTTAGPVQGYRAMTADSVTKTRTSIERLPFSVAVVPRTIIEDQLSLSIAEAVSNVSNVQAENKLVIGNTDLQALRIRGFSAEQWLDGLVVTYNAGFRDALAHVERIEVLKGPNAILYGGGPGAPVGGAVNVISKLPTPVASKEFGVTFGSHDYFRPYFDINQPLSSNGTVLFRMTGEYLSADSFIDVLETKSYSLNPSLTLTNKIDTSLTIQAFASRSEQQAYPGLPVTGSLVGGFRIDRDTFLGPKDMPLSFSEVQGITVSLDHKFDSVWSANVKARWRQGEFVQKSALLINNDFSGATPLIPPSTWGVSNTKLFQQQQEFTVTPSAQAKFDVGVTKNTLLVGADYSRVTDKGAMISDFPPSALVDLTNPVFPPYTEPFSSPFPFFDFDNVYTTKGVYAQLQSTLLSRIHLMAGLRLANVDIQYFEKSLGLNFQTDETKLLPRAGVVVEVLPGVSVFGSYSEGLRGVPFSQAALELKPEQSKQLEAGIRFNSGTGLTGTVAVFEIERSNIPVGLGGFVAALSEQLSRGFEADVLWQASRNWQLLASYAYTNAEFADDVQNVPKGNKVPAVPEHSGRVWANYTFDESVLPGWSIGAGIYLASGSFVDAANLYKTEGYYTLDAKIGYKTEHYSAAFHVKNITDEEYFVPYTWLGGQVAPGEGRTFYGTFSYRY